MTLFAAVSWRRNVVAVTAASFMGYTGFTLVRPFFPLFIAQLAVMLAFRNFILMMTVDGTSIRIVSLVDLATMALLTAVVQKNDDGLICSWSNQRSSQ